ncbi:MAG: ABC transporter substrate-binding protein [Chthoniobacterales bacterium]
MKLRMMLAALAALMLVYSGCKKSGTPAVTDGIKVGEFTSLTGINATFGQSSNNGTQLAVQEINAAGGVLGKPIQLIVEDTLSKAGETATIVHNLISRDHVVALLGEVASGRSLEAAPIAQQSKIPMISPSSTNEKVTLTGDYIFRICFIDSFQGKVMSKFARSIGVKRVAILMDSSKDYSTGLAESFKNDFIANNGIITGEQSYQMSDKDFHSQLTAIKSQNPEAIFLPDYYTEAPLIMLQARQLGIDVPFMGTDGWDSPELLSVGGTAVEGNYFSNHFSHESAAPKVQQFVKNYKAKYGSAPDGLAALGYDSVYFLVDAMKRAGSTESAKLRDALAATQNFDGVTGMITLDSNRDAIKSAVVIRIQEGNFRFLESVDP